jgi:hypothetical protein
LGQGKKRLVNQRRRWLYMPNRCRRAVLRRDLFGAAAGGDLMIASVMTAVLTALAIGAERRLLVCHSADEVLDHRQMPIGPDASGVAEKDSGISS